MAYSPYSQIFTIFTARQDAGRLLPDTIHAKLLTSAEDRNKTQRVVIVGDVHGCLDELRELLQKVNYTQGSDLLLFNGDMVNKGPFSVEVPLALA